MPATLDDLLSELTAIRLLLAAKPAPSAGTHYVGPPASTSAKSGAPGKFDDEPVPQPGRAWSIADADAHEIHFGKNAGIALGKLSDNSLAFYAKEKPQKINDKTGKPYAKRDEDIALDNAARTLWHHRRGTLAQPAPAQAATPPAATQTTDPSSIPAEDVPF
jgi:hypothetical protein